MSVHARLLLLSRNESWLHGMGEELDRLGLRTLCATDPEAAGVAVGDLNMEAALVDDELGNRDIADRLRAAAAPRHIPVVLVRRDDDFAVPPGWDMVFTRDAHPQQIVLAVEHLVRACVAEEEYDVRCQTLKIEQQNLDSLTELQSPLTILSIGQPDPEYLAVTHELRASKVEVTAALSSYSAFDYLHDKAFDAVLLWGGAQPSEALSIASGMRRNTRLYHTPVLLRLNRTAELDFGDAYLRGVNDVANPRAAPREIADRLLRLAYIHRRQLTIRRTLENMRGDARMDPSTGLFGRDLFAAHLARLAQAASDRGRSLSICVLRIAETPEVVRARQRKSLDHAVPQIGSMIARLVRAEDTGGRLSNEVFALALPATSLAAARSVGERISAVVGCTAFDSGAGRPPYVVEFDVGAAQIREGEAAADALARAAAAIGAHKREAV